MLLSKIEAGPPGYDYRTFECQNCGRVHTMIVSGDPLESDVNGWLLGEVMPPNSFTHQRLDCIAQATFCREKAQADPARHDYWIDEAVVWHQRAVDAGRGIAVTHEIHAGQMIPKPATWGLPRC